MPLLTLCPLNSGWVSKGPMDLFGVSWKGRTRFAHAVANRDDGVKVLVAERIQMVGMLRLQIDPTFRHGRKREGVNRHGSGASAEDLNPISTELTKEALRHLRARRVAGAEEEDASRVLVHL
jgi:hypothetical protein